MTTEGLIVAPGTRLVGPDGADVKAYTPPTNGEVIAQASKKCGGCRGSGVIKLWVYRRGAPCDNQGTIAGLAAVGLGRTGGCKDKCRCEPDYQIKIPKVCACAVRRWERKHGVDIITGKPKAEA